MADCTHHEYSFTSCPPASLNGDICFIQIEGHRHCRKLALASAAPLEHLQHEEAIVACLGSFLFAIIYEALEALRHNLLLRAACNNRCPLPYNSTMHTHNSFGGSTACPGCSIPSDNNSNKVYLNPPDANDEIHVNVAPDSYVQRLRSFCSGYHLVQTFLHMLHTFMGYMLMLIVMTYNVYLLLAVIFGFTLGYFLFAQNRALLLRSHSCCH
uniref:Copper transport protein n=1 Tax=Trichobilharzia regenti TaxID=157069 RepID=A0AA85JQV4_TRIRE|nr:unnamed protein product [Trichobilharzia regenti]